VHDNYVLCSCMCVGMYVKWGRVKQVGKRQTDRETDRERETDRHAGRQKDRQTDRKAKHKKCQSSTLMGRIGKGQRWG